MRPRTSRPTRPGYRAARRTASANAAGTARSNACPSSSRGRRRIVGRDDSMGQFRRFLLVGVGNTVISFVVYRLLLAAETPYVLAAALGFSAGAVNGYILNRRWTFAARD